jgi:hypothetical protein
MDELITFVRVDTSLGWCRDLRLRLSRHHTPLHSRLAKLKKVFNWEPPLAAGRGRGMAGQAAPDARAGSTHHAE